MCRRFFLIGLRRDEPSERLLRCVEGHHTCRMLKRKNILRGRDKFVACLSVFSALTKMKCLFLTYLTCVIPKISCVFTAMPSKIEKPTSQYRKSRIREMKEDTSDKYTYSLVKNQVCTIIHMRGIRKNVLPGKLYKALYGDAMLVSL